jgi:hypothetical protein
MMGQVDTKHTLSEAGRMRRAKRFAAANSPCCLPVGGDVLLCFGRVSSGAGERQASSKMTVSQKVVNFASMLLVADSWRRLIFRIL